MDSLIACKKSMANNGFVRVQWMQLGWQLGNTQQMPVSCVAQPSPVSLWMEAQQGLHGVFVVLESEVLPRLLESSRNSHEQPLFSEIQKACPAQ